MHLLLTLQHFFQQMASAKKYLSCILICWIRHWTTNSPDALISDVSTILILIGNLRSKYDSDIVQSSLLMVGFRQQYSPLITFLCRSLIYLHQLLPQQHQSHLPLENHYHKSSVLELLSPIDWAVFKTSTYCGVCSKTVVVSELFSLL